MWFLLFLFSVVALVAGGSILMGAVTAMHEVSGFLGLKGSCRDYSHSAK